MPTLIDPGQYAFLTQAQKDAQAAAAPSPVSSPGALSSEQGAQIVQQKTDTLNRLAPAPAPSTGANAAGKEGTFATNPKTGMVEFTAKGASQQNTSEPDTVTFINPQTEQTQTVKNPTQQQIQSYKNSGWDVMESSTGSDLDLLGSGSIPQSLLDARDELDSLKDGLAQFQVSDAALQATIDGISQKWDARIRDMERVNKSRVASLNQTGIRLGSRYTGDMFGGIITEEERQGVSRIGELEGEKQAAIAAARQAAQEQNWKVYSKKVDMAEKKYTEQLSTLEALQKAQAEQSAKLTADERLSNIALGTAELMKKGILDPKELISSLAKFGIKASAKELKDAMDAFGTGENEDIGKVYQSAVNMGAPQDLLDAILETTTIKDAYRVAGSYASNASGVVGEFNRAKLEGYAGSFDDYQTADANRKRQIINLNAGGLTTQENQTYLTITNKYQADPIINAAIKGGQIRSLADQIIADPNSATNQLASLYIFVKNLDPDSAVREGELALANQTQSYFQKYNNSLVRVSAGRVLSPSAAKELAEATKKLVATWEDTAEKKTKLYQSQAQNSSPNVGAAFNSYVSDFYTSPSTEETLKQSDEDVAQKLKDYGSEHPDEQSMITDLLTNPQPETGQPYTPAEVAEILGI